MFQGIQKLVIVPLVKSDTRLVQNICHTDQTGADLGCQADSLRLAAGQRASRTRQGKVFQTDIDKEADPRPNLFQNRRTDRLLHRRQLQRIDKFAEFDDRHIGRLENIFPANRNCQRFLL